jgi:hypothetical protein
MAPQLHTQVHKCTRQVGTMGIVSALLLGTIVGVLAVLLLLGIVLSVCRLATGQPGQLSRDEEKQAAAKGLLYQDEDPTEQEASSPDELFASSNTGSKPARQTVATGHPLVDSRAKA